MDSCNDQHNYSGYNDLYLYPCCRTVCHNGNDGYHHCNTDHADLCCDRSIVPELCCSGASCQFDQYSGYHRNLEPCNDQHNYSGYNDLYLYPCSRTVCHNGNDRYYHINTDHTSVYRHSAVMSEQYGTGITVNLHQWYHRHVDSGNDQHNYGGNVDLYLYANGEPVCNDN